jgi:hypothetical protein
MKKLRPIPVPGNPEPWVDLNAVAEHIGFSYMATRQMVQEGKIPGFPRKSGKKTFWRFKLSVVDAAMLTHQEQ